MEQKEITISKISIISNIKKFTASLIASFIILLLIALTGTIRPSNPSNTYNSEICYYGVLSDGKYCNSDDSKMGQSIMVYYSYTYDNPNTPTEQQKWINPPEDEQWSIPETMFTRARKSADVTFFDKLLVIYLPLILFKNLLIWILLSLALFFIIRLKSKYKFKVD